jgi:predicted secreted protein
MIAATVHTVIYATCVVAWAVTVAVYVAAVFSRRERNGVNMGSVPLAPSGWKRLRARPGRAGGGK